MRLSRRGFLGLAAAAGAGAAAGVATGASGDEAAASDEVVPFHGERQAGIVTPAQDRLHMAAFDVSPGVSRDELRDLLRDWTAAASRMTAGRLVGAVSDPLAPPIDTGEADGLPPARLSVTFGFGPSLFDDRFGLAARLPAALQPLPALPGETLQPERTGGDLCVQACANDPQVAFHAIRNLARLGRGTVVMRWSQLGFGRTSSTSRYQATPRNLMGFKDGTNNITAEQTEQSRGAAALLEVAMGATRRWTPRRWRRSSARRCCSAWSRAWWSSCARSRRGGAGMHPGRHDDTLNARAGTIAR